MLLILVLLELVRFVAHFVLQQTLKILVSAIVTLSDVVWNFASLAHDIGGYFFGKLGGSFYCVGHHVIFRS